MEVTRSAKGTATTPLVQTQDQATWTVLLAPGTYSSITAHEDVDTCLVQYPPNHRYLLTNTGGYYAVSGTPLRT